MRNELTVYQPAVSVIAVLTPSDLGFAMVLLPTLRPDRQAQERGGRMLVLEPVWRRRRWWR